MMDDVAQVILAANCVECGQPFAFLRGKGRARRRFCSDACRSASHSTQAKSKPRCSTDGCTNSQQYAALKLCGSCYYRRRRTGTVDKRPWKFRTLTTHGYISIKRPDHPLSVNGFVYEHRLVLYDAIGPGPHRCHWCGSTVDWIRGRCCRGALVPDHLDGDKQNNHLANLVASCNPCNAKRGLFMSWLRNHKDDPVIWELYLKAREAKSA